MAEIPKQLAVPGFRFLVLKTGKESKHPLGEEKGWPERGGRSHDDKFLVQKLKEGHNYGVIAGPGDLVIIDCDSWAASDMWLKALIRMGITTFSVVSSKDANGKDRMHLYFICPDLGEFTHDDRYIKISIPAPTDKDPDAEKEFYSIRGDGGHYCVGPGSVHPDTGKPYTVRNNSDIDTIPFKELLRISMEIETTIPKKIKTDNEYKDAGPPIADILEKYGGMDGLKRKGNTLIGSHPVHGSETGQNFHVDLDNNAWYCHRCKSGGYGLQLIAVLEKFIDCKDSHMDKKDRGVIKRTSGLYTKIRDVVKDKFGVELPAPGPPKGKSGDKDFPSVEEVCNLIMSRHGILTAGDNRHPDFLFFDPGNGIYRDARTSEHILTSEIAAALGGRYTATFAGNVERLLSSILTALGQRQDAALVKNPNKIVVRAKTKDGEKNVLLDLESGDVAPCSPDVPRFFVVGGGKYLYDPAAKCPKFDAFLQDRICTPDKAPEEQQRDINRLQEFSGYVLMFAHYKIPFIMWILGPARSGKGTFCTILRHVYGFDNCDPGGGSIDEYAKETVLDSMKSKLAVIDSEVDTSRAHQAGTTALKKLTGGDPYKSRRLYRNIEDQPPNTTKIIFASNHIPVFYDMGETLGPRLLYVVFSQSIPQDKQDPAFIAQFTDEIPGILNWAIEGYKRIVKNGLRFSFPPDGYDRGITTTLSDPMGNFITDCIDVPYADNAIHEAPLVSSLELYITWIAYVKVKGIKVDRAQERRGFGKLFKARCKQLDIKLRQGHARTGNDTHGFRGIAIVRGGIKGLNDEYLRIADEYGLNSDKSKTKIMAAFYDRGAVRLSEGEIIDAITQRFGSIDGRTLVKAALDGGLLATKDGMTYSLTAPIPPDFNPPAPVPRLPAA